MRLQATGLRAWWVQRVSAVYMLSFILLALVSLLVHPVHSYAEWRNGFAHPAAIIASLSFFAALLSHVWVGLRDVLIDYARPRGFRLCLLSALGAVLVGIEAWVSWILLRTWP